MGTHIHVSGLSYFYTDDKLRQAFIPCKNLVISAVWLKGTTSQGSRAKDQLVAPSFLLDLNLLGVLSSLENPEHHW